MASSQQPRIVVVTRETRLKDLLRRWATRGQARYRFAAARAAAAYQANDLPRAAASVETEDPAFLDLEREDTTYDDSIKRLATGLDFGIPVQVIDRQYVPNHDFGLCAAVVVVGQDGLVANTAKYAGDVPIVGVNPDPERFDGVLLPFRVDQAGAAISALLKGRARIRPVTMAEVTLQDGQSMLAFNDLFIGMKTHVSARYRLRIGRREEQHSSSGVLVSTGAGSTGWMSSVFNMAAGVARSVGAGLPDRLPIPLPWEDRRLLWAVREPFASHISQASLVAGELGPGDVMEIDSLASSDGVIFSDGMESDFLEFNGGAIARIGIAKQQARLVVT